MKMMTVAIPARCDAKIAVTQASIADGAIITTGGGFSDTDPRPSWQASAVNKSVHIQGYQAGD